VSQQAVIGKEAVTLSDQFLRSVVVGAEVLLKNIVAKVRAG
jgi:hypothetical protein